MVENQLYTEITKCRLCKQSDLKSIFRLENTKLSGIFPRPEQPVDGGPLELLYCEMCSLVQLKQSYNPSQMYGMNYGYKSSLNKSMLVHLYDKVNKLQGMTLLGSDDIVLDIGSNDGSTLAFYNPRCKLVGMDPTGIKFKESYRSDITLIPDFFSAKTFKEHFGNKKAKIVTSIAMMYDLEDPVSFFKDVASILHTDGIWHIEQSYLPLMLSQNAYDTICHEHIEYYSLKQIELMATMANLKIIDVDINDVNGGSFYVTMAHRTNSKQPKNINLMNQREYDAQLDNMQTYIDFKNRIDTVTHDLKQLILQIKNEGKTIIGYGASTKGNILLQHAGITKEDIPVFAEVNPDKFGCVTPGTNIPIVSEDEARSLNPDYFLVLPWHFKQNIISREKEFLKNGGKLIFPLPTVTVVGNTDV
jgi:hypothetical protein